MTAIYCASLTHACYIVLFCHGSTEQDHAQETDQSSDSFTINDVLGINDRHYFNIFSMDARHQTIFSILNQQIKLHMWLQCKKEDPFQASFYILQTKTCLPVLIMSSIVRKPDFCLGENKGSHQLRSNCEADQSLCFRYADSTIPLLSKSKISRL